MKRDLLGLATVKEGYCCVRKMKIRRAWPFSWLSSVFTRECVKLVHKGLADPQFLARTRISSPQLRETTDSELKHCTEIPAWEQVSIEHLTSLETVRICFQIAQIIRAKHKCKVTVVR